jgi:predicted acylesterase/phospholipase RssA
MAANDYAHPTRLCDLVMKGGITSGVVYPLAVCELATAYSFKNIGGTSAGAIAAAAAAAAEYDRRQHGAGATGFTTLTELPGELGRSGRLLKMFQPDASTRELFAMVIAALNPRTTTGKVAAVVLAAVRRFWVRTIVAIAADWMIYRWAAADGLGGDEIVIAILAMLAVDAIFVASIIVTLVLDITRTIPANAYGLSHGFDPKATDGEPPLTNWLTWYLDALAGKKPGEGPLTFGDLHNANRAPGEPADSGPRSINLEMMTTAINLGRPFRLPFRDPDRRFYFSPREFAQLFPRRIVDHMVAHARVEKETAKVKELPGGEKLYGFPDEEHLPVIVATRMSLSFPLLLSAVPLYAVDYTRTKDVDRIPERAWFSDGGICSNLPIHFFDAAVPQWPTFAINLKGFHPDHQAEEEAVWLPTNAGSGWRLHWTRFRKPGMPSLPEFFGAIVDTMQNWQDNTQARVPGYRDRLVHVSHRDDEGGMNLNMDDATIGRLAHRGKVAGQLLRQRFHDNGGAGWSEHRWVRFRSTMSLTFPWLHQVVTSYAKSSPPDPLMRDVLMRPPAAPPESYELAPANQRRADAAMQALSALGAAIDPDGTGFMGGVPHPLPDLRIKPRV